ncbi:response regulator transcription factor [Massilicoli timonensis]|uniref:response regulator transcription factor n=1 Tax=Massilicoli timonensis TaxID=2015901 RepID=UPI003079A84A
MFQVLVVEDDRELRDLFCAVLEENGYHAIAANDGLQAFDLLENHYIDLIISDVMMPKLNGFEMTQAIRNAGYTMPILIISAKGQAADKQKGFQSGIDDYMVKPIDVNEMIWRVEALLRRSQIISQRKVRIGSSELNSDTYTLRCGEQEVVLPQKEFLLLFKLLSAPDRIFTRTQIMDEIWGVDQERDSHTLDVHISRLREKCKDNPDFDIVTMRGLGYKAVARK